MFAMLGSIWLKAVLVVCAVSAIIGVKYGLGWKDGNVVEVVAEEIIKEEIGEEIAIPGPDATKV